MTGPRGRAALALLAELQLYEANVALLGEGATGAVLRAVRDNFERVYDLQKLHFPEFVMAMGEVIAAHGELTQAYFDHHAIERTGAAKSPDRALRRSLAHHAGAVAVLRELLQDAE